MAKKVRGHRANKPNDSFGTINSETLYKVVNTAKRYTKTKKPQR